MYEKILVPLDGSLRAETILPHVEGLALSLNASVILLYVDETSDFAIERDEVVDVNAYLEKRRKRIKNTQAYLQAIIDKWCSSISMCRCVSVVVAL
jgi:nucleotide-binding universal stress UspA family protein